MREFQRRRGEGKVKAALAVLGVVTLAVVAVFAAQGVWGMYQKFASASADDAAAQAQLGTLKDQYQKLDAAVTAYQSGRGVEAAVRERWGVARPGESEIDIIRVATTSAPIAVEVGFWARLWHAIFVW
ncbi:MAG: hypothetical protein KGI70_00040 [Patescibacteria group bacterium]|nr:hypothetical protein [Patescibacteria group bacterium]